MARVRRVAPIVLSITLAACGGGAGGGTQPNTPPVADAGRAQVSLRNVVVLLDGSASHDVDGDPLSFRWSIASKPAGSGAAIAGSGSTATFVPDMAGTYTVGLVVNDGKADGAMATVVVTALDQTSALHDTGVTTCFSASAEIPCPSPAAAFYGQDATYSSNPMLFVDDGTIVADALTGLEWQKVDTAGTFNWYEASGTYDATYNATAKNVCGALALGGHFDWRLPSRRELVSIVNYARGWLDPSGFTGGATYWTSTRLGSPTGTNIWVVLGDGQVNGAMGFQEGLAAPYSVKCVRGATWGLNAFADQGNGTVLDSMSGLLWQQVDDGVARTWQSALDYCEQLALAGYTDWRLPDIKELESLVYFQSGGFTVRVDSALFTPRVDGSGLSFYWSSTTQPGSGGVGALGVEFYDATVTYGGFAKPSYKFARCVR